MGRRRLSFGAGGLILVGTGLFACERCLLLDGFADAGADVATAWRLWVLISGGTARDKRRDCGLGLEDVLDMLDGSEGGAGVGAEEGGFSMLEEICCELSDLGFCLLLSSCFGSLCEVVVRPPPRPPRGAPRPRPPRPDRLLRPLKALPGSPLLPHLALVVEEDAEVGVAMIMNRACFWHQTNPREV